MDRTTRQFIIYVSGTVMSGALAWWYMDFKEALFTVAMCSFLIFSFTVLDMIGESEKNGKT